jgi:hypothetical protein
MRLTLGGGTGVLSGYGGTGALSGYGAPSSGVCGAAESRSLASQAAELWHRQASTVDTPLRPLLVKKKPKLRRSQSRTGFRRISTKRRSMPKSETCAVGGGASRTRLRFGRGAPG